MGVLDSLPQDNGWALDEDCLVVIAEHPVLGMVGGCRLQMAKPGRSLPFEIHIQPLQKELDGTPVDLLSEKCAELCGLWVAHRFAGHGLPWYLTAAAVSLAIELPIDSLVCFAAEYSSDYACRNGFIKMLSIGDQGAFTFPTPDIRSFALINNEPIGLGYAGTEERQRLISLRLNPNQSRVEKMKDVHFDVHYCLKLQQGVHPFPAIPLTQRAG